MLGAPAVDSLPTHAVSWYLLCRSHELRRGPMSREMLGRRLVAYRTTTGRVVVLDARCSHLGADLGLGHVVGEAIRCPYHHWEYGPDGRCSHVPAEESIPAFARQVSYPVAERHGYVFVFNGPEPLFPLPFFRDCEPAEFRAAEPFSIVLDCPWYMIGGHFFDLQHLLPAHSRRLIGPPVVECPAPFARGATGTFQVTGNSLQDRITRRFAGDEVTLSLTSWCGTLMYTTAMFRRTTSYAMVAAEPLANGGVRARLVVFIRRSRGVRALLDPLRLAVRRFFIMRFLGADAPLMNGVHYNPHTLIDSDRHLADYCRWLAGVAHGRSQHDDRSAQAAVARQSLPQNGTPCRPRSL